MQKEINNTVTVSEAVESKSVWQCPTISRIDIKRTMNGSPGLADLSGGNQIT